VKVGSTEIVVVRGSVVHQDVDAIVNAANTAMRGGGGVDGAIHAAAGPALLDELIKVAPNGAETGTVVVTGGHQLKQKWIFHTPGPIWRGGHLAEPQELASCYRGCLRAAEEKGIKSIAFCSISTGIYGFPIQRAAPIAVDAAITHVKTHPETRLERIVFAMYGAAEHHVFETVLAGR
jgi:O-acetyl-ADP-ribose deacetylase (regulator of RNase III)